MVAANTSLRKVQVYQVIFPFVFRQAGFVIPPPCTIRICNPVLMELGYSEARYTFLNHRSA